MIGTLIKKDMARLRVNWPGLLVLLAMPLCITGMVGTVFGPAAQSGKMPRIKLAVVNEDDNVVGGMIAGMASSDQSEQYLDAVVTDQSEAMRLINRNKISAVIIVPEGFSEKFLAGEEGPPIQLVKNPAQAYMPAITEELVRVVAEVLDAVAQNLTRELPEVLAIVSDSEAEDVQKFIRVFVYVGNRIERAEGYLFPPIIGINRSKIETETESESAAATSEFNVFAFVMPGLVAVFLLFTADGTTRDLFAEQRNRTLDRFRTLSIRLLPFLVAKSVYSIFVVLISAVIMLLGGSLIFGITWQHPLAVTCLTVSYSVFSIGFAYLLVGVVYREQLTAMINSVVIMVIGFLGGSMMPSQNLPAIIRDNVSPWMPNHVFAEAIKRVQFDFDGPHWATASTQLFVSGVIMLVVATSLFQRRLQAGPA